MDFLTDMKHNFMSKGHKILERAPFQINRRGMYYPSDIINIRKQNTFNSNWN